jgi:hypothetical protein
MDSVWENTELDGDQMSPWADWGAWLVSVISLYGVFSLFRQARHRIRAAIPRPGRYTYGGFAVRFAVGLNDADQFAIAEIRRSDGKNVVRMDNPPVESLGARRMIYNPPVTAAIVRNDPFIPGERWEVKVVTLASGGLYQRFKIEPE